MASQDSATQDFEEALRSYFREHIGAGAELIPNLSLPNSHCCKKAPKVVNKQDDEEDEELDDGPAREAISLLPWVFRQPALA
jgi:hypothetical protein